MWCPCSQAFRTHYPEAPQAGDEEDDPWADLAGSVFKPRDGCGLPDDLVDAAQELEEVGSVSKEERKLSVLCLWARAWVHATDSASDRSPACCLPFLRDGLVVELQCVACLQHYDVEMLPVLLRMVGLAMARYKGSQREDEEDLVNNRSRSST